MRICVFYCKEKESVIELDGPIHELNEEYDQFRDSEMKEKGINVLRIKNEELLGNPEMAFKRIEEAAKNILNKKNLSLNPSP